ncbi:hypothetical protein [Candidatus Viridilinea mediisalina]|uniref:Uncharacterized protein n=1 Tax=Candidatus Viridilinea mediisalina TaxID=2024553 RepID=A0A2A6RK74_9CHLR|nr:hypothetical protein [Candidatus Viridilinea mediisalina]PDW03286.1 hypothetical protein CJ255_09575 [Candidatus Viridilinea mediisalina]
METDLISYLMQDKIEAFEQERVQWRQAMQNSIEDIIASRFPDAPLGLIMAIRQIDDMHELQLLLRAILRATDLDEVGRLLET